MYYYAIIDDNLIATAVVATTELVSPANSMALSDYDTSIIGKQWNGTSWEDLIILSGNSTVTLTKLEFYRLFTQAERVAIYSSTDPLVLDFVRMMSMAQEVSMDDPDVVAGVNYLETLNLLASGRADEVLA